MADYEMKRNGSGYYDETAYLAMKNLAKPGEIWETSDGKKEVLILNNHGTFCNCLTLTDRSLDPNCIEVYDGRNAKYTNPAMVQYLFNSFLGTYVKKVPAQEYSEIMEAVAVALDIHEPEPVKMTKAQMAHELLDMILEGVK